MTNMRFKTLDRNTFRLDPALISILAHCVYQPTNERINNILDNVYGQAETGLFGLYAGDQCVAVAGTRQTGEGTSELLHIAVLPNNRSQGYGRMFIDRLIRQEGMRELVAETDSDAVGFYRNCGFEVQSLGEKYPGVERFLCSWRAN